MTKRTCLSILVIRTESTVKPTEEQNKCKEPQFKGNCSNAQSCDNREICDPEQKIQCCCPDGLYRSGDKCVKKEECLCYHNGITFVRFIVFFIGKDRDQLQLFLFGRNCNR